MKKTMKVLLSLTLIVAIALTMVACGNKEKETTDQETTTEETVKTPEGKYIIKSVKADGEEESLEEAVEALGLNPEDQYYEFNEDGTGTVSYLGMTAEFTWKDNTLKANGASMDFEFDGDSLIVKSEEGELICRK